MKLAESGDLAAATATIAAVAVVVAAAVAAFLTAAAAAMVLGLEFLGGGITHELHNTGITYGLAGQLMVEVHGHLFVGHLGHNALDAHAVLGHHRDDGTRAHVLVVKLAVHMENLFLQFVDQVGVLLAESLLGFEREIKLLTLMFFWKPSMSDMSIPKTNASGCSLLNLKTLTCCSALTTKISYTSSTYFPA